MKSFFVILFALASLASAKPALKRDNTDIDTANDWDKILNGDSGATCADLAIIFARGTFDSGNIGPWVGGPFRDALKATFDSVAFQGVSPDAYPADLAGYLKDASPESCAMSLAHSVATYASICSGTKFIISGWSQGALCAHKSFNASYELGDGDVLSRVIALVAFGDPVGVWADSYAFPILPPNTQYLGYCDTITPDPLCSNPIENIPHSAEGLVEYLKGIWEQIDETQLNTAQRSAVASLIVDLPEQALSLLSYFVTDILDGYIRRLLLTPEHFWYGIDGAVYTAVSDINGIYGV